VFSGRCEDPHCFYPGFPGRLLLSLTLSRSSRGASRQTRKSPERGVGRRGHPDPHAQARTIARPMAIVCDWLSKSETLVLAAIRLRLASRCSSRSVWRRVEPRRDKSNVSRHPGSGELASSSPVFAWIFADQVAPIVRVGAENERELVRFHLCVSEASAIVSTLTRSMNALSRFALWTSSRSWRWRPSP